MAWHGLGSRSRSPIHGSKGCPSPFYYNDHIACLFCGDVLYEAERDKYAGHVGRHMEEIAFAVVTKPYEAWDFYSDSSGKSKKNEDREFTPFDTS